MLIVQIFQLLIKIFFPKIVLKKKLKNEINLLLGLIIYTFETINKLFIFISGINIYTKKNDLN